VSGSRRDTVARGAPDTLYSRIQMNPERDIQIGEVFRPVKVPLGHGAGEYPVTKCEYARVTSK
jgi:hypothetical protein